MPAKKRIRLTYFPNEMKWKNSDGKVVDHPVHSKRPARLDSTAFRNAYLTAVRSKMSLNEFMKTYQAFDYKDVQKQARIWKKAFDTWVDQHSKKGDKNKPTFNLLRKKTIKNEEDTLGQEIFAEMMKGNKKAAAAWSGYGSTKHLLDAAADKEK